MTILPLYRLRARRGLAGLLAHAHCTAPGALHQSFRQTSDRLTSAPLFFALAAAAFAIWSLAPATAPVAPLLGYLFGKQLRRGRESTRAYRFAAELPPLLLATASLLRGGLSLQEALRRSTEALPIASSCRGEFIALLNRCDETVPLGVAVGDFGTSIALPELEMFRSALALSAVHGGRLSASLSRLARVSSDRALLIRSASAATAQMRLTASILLCLTPLFLGLSLIGGTSDLSRLSSNPIAFAVASAGLLLILASYLTLLYMSDFKP